MLDQLLILIAVVIGFLLGRFSFQVPQIMGSPKRKIKDTINSLQKEAFMTIYDPEEKQKAEKFKEGFEKQE